MRYTTEGRIRALLGHPSERDLASDLINLLAGKCEAWINSMLAHLYTVPFNAYTDTPTPETPSTPEIVMSWTEDMACFKILKHPGFRQRSGVDTAMVEQAREIAVRGVMEAARRKSRIPELKARTTTYSSTASVSRFFGLDEPEDWKLDPDIVREQKTARGKS